MAATDAKAIPIKNAAYRVTFPILDADGDLVTGATGLDSEVSIDGAAFADATSEATEIATSSGMYFLDLTAGEMNGDTIAIIVKTTSSGAKTTPLVLYTAARSINDLAFPTVSGRSLDVSAGGEAGVDWANVGTPGSTVSLSATTVATVTTTTTATNVTTVNGLAAGVITAAAIASAAIDADALAVDTGLKPIRTGTAQAGAASTITLDAGASATDDLYLGAVVYLTGGTGVGQTDTIHDYVGATKVATISQTFATTPDATTTFALLPGGTVRAGAVLDKSGYSLAAGAITAAVVATDAIDADALAADAVTEIWNKAAVEPTAVPAVTATMVNLLSWILALSRNKITQTSTTQTLRNDADAATIATSTVSDDGTTFTRGEWA